MILWDEEETLWVPPKKESLAEALSRIRETESRWVYLPMEGVYYDTHLQTIGPRNFRDKIHRADYTVSKPKTISTLW